VIITGSTYGLAATNMIFIDPENGQVARGLEPQEICEQI